MNRISKWTSLPAEVRNLFNPAFCGLVLNEIIQGYGSKKSSLFPIAYSFLALPLCLNKELRDSLPRTSKTSVVVWASENQELLPTLYDRAKGFSPNVFITINYLFENNLINLQGSEICSNILKKPNGFREFLGKDDEVSDIFKRAKIVGRWLAKSGGPQIVFSIFGVTP